MAKSTTEQSSALSEPLLNFTLLQIASEIGPRRGRLIQNGRVPIDTPHFIGNSSRGIVPHITQDIFSKHTSIQGLYTALEDFIEKEQQRTPPLYRFQSSDDDEGALRNFISLQSNTLLVLAARRVLPIPSPKANTNDSISICTADGFRKQGIAEFTSATQKLQPDIVVAVADIPYDNPYPSQKRREKMVDRTGEWVADLVHGRYGLDKLGKKEQYSVFAPILPIPLHQQGWLIEKLVDDVKHGISGLAFYDPATVAELPEELKHLTRMSLGGSRNPVQILYEVSLGLDLFVVPFIGDVTDAGIALNFEFPPAKKNDENGRRPLGLDMWHTSHALELLPLKEDCICYACTKHHRAYLQHLLSAKEMLAWVLLQIHNHHVMDKFFEGIRKSIADGTFEADREQFEQIFEPELPEQTGKGPRMRGYQYKSEGPGESKKNGPAYRMLDEGKEKVKEAIVLAPTTGATQLEKAGFANVDKTMS